MNEQIKQALSQAEQAFVIGNYDFALKQCQIAIKMNSSALMAYVIAGNSCYVMRNFREAEKYYKKSIELDGKNGEYYFYLGNSLVAQDKLSEALRYYARAESLKCSDKTRQKLYYAIGKINQKNGDYENALLNYKKIEDINGINSDLREVLLNCVEIYVEQKNWDEAENCAVQLKLLMPSNFKNYQLIFQIMLQKKNIEEAIDVLKEAEMYCEITDEIRVEITFDYVMIDCFLAEQNQEKKEEFFKEALNKLQDLKNMSIPIDVLIEVQLTEADILLNLDKYKEAIEIVEKIANMEDDSLIDYIEKAQFVLMNCYIRNKNYCDLKELAVKLKSSKNMLYRHHAYYSEFLSLNKMAKENPNLKNEVLNVYNKAIAYYKSATIVSPQDFVALIYRAQIYAEAGNFEKAEKISEMLPDEAKNKLLEHIDQCRKDI